MTVYGVNSSNVAKCSYVRVYASDSGRLVRNGPSGDYQSYGRPYSQ